MSLAVCESAEDVRRLARERAEWRRKQFAKKRAPAPFVTAPVIEAVEPAPEPIPAEVVDRALDRIESTAVMRPPPTTASRIMQLVCVRFNMPGYLLTSDRRTPMIVRPRQIAMWLCHMHTNLSYPQIGRKFGGKDHTTVIHAVRRIEEMRRTHPDIATIIAELEAEILA